MRALPVAACDADRGHCQPPDRSERKPRRYSAKEKEARKKYNNKKKTNRARVAKANSIFRIAVQNEDSYLREEGWVTLRAIFFVINNKMTGMRLLRDYRDGNRWGDFGRFLRAYDAHDICTPDELNTRRINFEKYTEAIKRYQDTCGPIPRSGLPKEHEPRLLEHAVPLPEGGTLQEEPAIVARSLAEFDENSVDWGDTCEIWEPEGSCAGITQVAPPGPRPVRTEFVPLASPPQRGRGADEGGSRACTADDAAKEKKLDVARPPNPRSAASSGSGASEGERQGGGEVAARAHPYELPRRQVMPWPAPQASILPALPTIDEVAVDTPAERAAANRAWPSQHTVTGAEGEGVQQDALSPFRATDGPTSGARRPAPPSPQCGLGHDPEDDPSNKNAKRQKQSVACDNSSEVSTACPSSGDVISQSPSCVDGGDVANMHDVDDVIANLHNAGQFAPTTNDVAYWDSLVGQQIWNLPQFMHLFRDKGEYVEFKFTNKRIWKDAVPGQGQHIDSREYLEQLRIACTATNLFGPFDRDMVPNAPRRVPTLDEIRAGYGAHLPSLGVMARYTPGIMTCFKKNKDKTRRKSWLLPKIWAWSSVLGWKRRPEGFPFRCAAHTACGPLGR